MIKKLYWFLFVRDLNESLVQSASDTGIPLKRKLKQDLAYVVLFSYIFFIFSPLIPLASDIIAHTFWKKEHMQSSHHKYGSNHVGIEIAKAEKRTGRENATNNQKNGLEDFSHTLAVNIQLDFPAERLLNQGYGLFICVTPVSWQDIDYPPPRL